MKKILSAVLAAALVGLAGCSNSADGAAWIPTALGTETERAKESQQPAAPQAPEAQEETWPQITPVDFNVDLEGFEECPKDPVYGINWVFVEKSVLDNNGSTAKKYLEGENIRLKPVELHKSNPNGVQFGHYQLGTFRCDEGAYKCVAYRKPGNASDYLAVNGCDFHYVPDGDMGYYSTEYLEVTRVASKKTIVKNGERFREVYKY